MVLEYHADVPMLREAGGSRLQAVIKPVRTHSNSTEVRVGSKPAIMPRTLVFPLPEGPNREVTRSRWSQKPGRSRTHSGIGADT